MLTLSTLNVQSWPPFWNDLELSMGFVAKPQGKSSADSFQAEMAVDKWRFGLGIYLLWFTLGLCFTSSQSKVIELREDDWKQILDGEWMIKFYAPWCPACKHIAPTWSAFAVRGKQLDINVAEVDVTTQSALSGRFMVASLPTIYHVKDGLFRVYTNPRSLDEFVDFVKEKKWFDIDPIPSWKAPGSYIMGGLGLVFKLSLSLKDLHDHFTVTYGLPVWASLLIFGAATVLAGIILGVVTVYAADFFFDRSQTSAPQAVQRAAGPVKKDSDGEDTKDVHSESAEAEEKKQEDSSVRKRKIQATTD